MGECRVAEPGGDVGGVEELKCSHHEGHNDVNGGHAGREEWGDQRAVEVMEDVEGSEEFILDGEAGEEEGGGCVRSGVEFSGEGVDDEEEVERTDGFSDDPADAAGEVEGGCDAGFSHGLEGGEGGPLD